MSLLLVTHVGAADSRLPQTQVAVHLRNLDTWKAETLNMSVLHMRPDVWRQSKLLPELIFAVTFRAWRRNFFVSCEKEILKNYFPTFFPLPDALPTINHKHILILIMTRAHKFRFLLFQNGTKSLDRLDSGTDPSGWFVLRCNPTISN